MKTKENNIVSPEGYSILIFSFLLSLALFHFHLVAGIVGFLWFLFCVYFFRNPKRKKTEDDSVIISPADGVVIVKARANEEDFLKKDMQKISVFMSPFNVHVNRNAVSGIVEAKACHKGDFKAAFAEEASNKNERIAVWYKTKGNLDVVVVQVAGWFARRIINYLQPKDSAVQGDICGVIKFGSRADLYLPEEYEIVVDLKQKVKAGQTVLAKRRSES